MQDLINARYAREVSFLPLQALVPVGELNARAGAFRRRVPVSQRAAAQFLHGSQFRNALLQRGQGDKSGAKMATARRHAVRECL